MCHYPPLPTSNTYLHVWRLVNQNLKTQTNFIAVFILKPWKENSSLCGPGHDSSVGERMYLTVYPLHGSGHDSSVGEWMYLTVCFLHGLGHDSSVGKCMLNHTVCPPRGPGHDSSVGEWMYLTVGPPRGAGHDRSVGEWVYHTVCPPHGVGHASPVGEWMNLSVCPPCGPSKILDHGRSISRAFFSADHMWCLVHRSGRTEGWREEWGPLIKRLQTHAY